MWSESQSGPVRDACEVQWIDIHYTVCLILTGMSCVIDES